MFQMFDPIPDTSLMQQLMQPRREEPEAKKFVQQSITTMTILDPGRADASGPTDTQFPFAFLDSRVLE